MTAKYKKPLMTAERIVKSPVISKFSAEAVAKYMRPVAKLAQVMEVNGFALGDNTSKVYDSFAEAEQAALHKYLFDIIATYCTYDGLDWNDLVLHLKENDVERRAFIKFLTNMDGS